MEGITWENEKDADNKETKRSKRILFMILNARKGRQGTL